MSIGDDIKVTELDDVATEDRVTSDRPDYTSDVTDVSVTIQAQRLAAVTFADVDTVNNADDENPTPSSAYNSGWQSAGSYTKIRGHIWANQAGTIYIEQTNEISSDSPLARVQSTQSYSASSESGGFTEEIVAPYVRIRFVPTTAPTQFVAWARLSGVSGA